MQVEKHHRIQVQQSSVRRNRANPRKQKLLGTKEGEFIIQHIDSTTVSKKKSLRDTTFYEVKRLKSHNNILPRTISYTTRNLMKSLLS